MRALLCVSQKLWYKDLVGKVGFTSQKYGSNFVQDPQQMKKSKIFLLHALVFVAGSGAIAAYFFYTIKNLSPEAALAGIALLPVGVVYIIGFGILCLISLCICLAVSSIKNLFRKKHRGGDSAVAK